MISPVKTWRRQKFVRTILGKKGKIITWTKIVVAGSFHKQFAPFPVVLVELEDGNRLYGQLVDYSEKDLKIGKKVYSILRKVRKPTEDGVIAYGVKFRPL
jgi:uncharacterized OB-fold protein